MAMINISHLITQENNPSLLRVDYSCIIYTSYKIRCKDTGSIETKPCFKLTLYHKTHFASKLFVELGVNCKFYYKQNGQNFALFIPISHGDKC